MKVQCLNKINIELENELKLNNNQIINNNDYITNAKKYQVMIPY